MMKSIKFAILGLVALAFGPQHLGQDISTLANWTNGSTSSEEIGSFAQYQAQHTGEWAAHEVMAASQDQSPMTMTDVFSSIERGLKAVFGASTTTQDTASSDTPANA